jgi:hypothetical protein
LSTIAVLVFWLFLEFSHTLLRFNLLASREVEMLLNFRLESLQPLAHTLAVNLEPCLKFELKNRVEQSVFAFIE